MASPFATGLPTGNGTYTWTPSVNMPGSVYNIQLLEVSPPLFVCLFASQWVGGL